MSAWLVKPYTVLLLLLAYSLLCFNIIAYMLISYKSLMHGNKCAYYLPELEILVRFNTITFVIAGLEASGKCNIQSESPQGTQPQRECESVFEYHDSSGRPAS